MFFCAFQYNADMITFFRTKILANKLVDNSVTEFQCLLYFTVPLVAEFLTNSYLNSFGFSNSDTTSIYDTIKTVIYFGGIFLAWWLNYRGDNKQFLNRYISLSFPATVKINIIGALYSFADILWSNLGLSDNTMMTIRNIFFIFNQLLFVFLVTYWIRYVSLGIKK
jgi:hypothetical protein